MNRKKTLLWSTLTVALSISVLSSCCGVYVRMGTTVLGEFPSPNGRWNALLMLRNGGAMGGFSTQISLVRTGSVLSRQFALFRPGNAFIVDSNQATAPSGPRGEIPVVIDWTSNSKLTVTYPHDARVFRRSKSVDSVSIEYHSKIAIQD